MAIKTLRGAAPDGSEQQSRLRREARLLARLDHPHVTGVLDLIEAEDEGGNPTPMLVTELLAGEDLRTRLSRGALDPGTALSTDARAGQAAARPTPSTAAAATKAPATFTPAARTSAAAPTSSGPAAGPALVPAAAVTQGPPAQGPIAQGPAAGQSKAPHTPPGQIKHKHSKD